MAALPRLLQVRVRSHAGTDGFADAGLANVCTDFDADMLCKKQR